MKIAVSMSMRTRQPYTDYLRHAYVPYLQGLGLTPILVPNAIEDPAAYLHALGVEAVLLTGGGDVEPGRYGQPVTHSIEIAPRRDEVEAQMLGYATERRLPVLAICRGMQVLNVFFGGGLLQDIRSELDGALDHNDDHSTHAVTLTDRRLADALDTAQITTNTHHHQGVTNPLLGRELDVFAVCAADGIIEGLRHARLPVLGVQWHPERPTPSTAYDHQLIRGFLAGAL